LSILALKPVLDKAKGKESQAIEACQKKIKKVIDKSEILLYYLTRRLREST